MASFLLSVVGALVAAFAPTGQVTEGSGAPGGELVTRSHTVSMFQINGAWILVVVSVPVLLTLIPVLMPRRTVRSISAVLLWLGCVVGLLSVGLFFVPAAIAMTVAATRVEPAPSPPLPPVPTRP